MVQHLRAARSRGRGTPYWTGRCYGPKERSWVWSKSSVGSYSAFPVKCYPWGVFDFSLSLMCLTCCQLSTCPLFTQSPCSIPPVPDCLVYVVSSSAILPWKSPCVRSVFRVPITEYIRIILIFIIKMTTDLECSLCVSILLDPPDLVPDTMMTPGSNEAV